MAQTAAARFLRLSADLVQERYAEVSYPGEIFAQTHPARHAAVARLFGLAAAPIATARVLEIGCAQGHNLLPLAARLPGARFTGVDFSAHEIARGRALTAVAGLTNVELLCADLRAYAPPPGAFDYIIAHGVFSWIPDDAKAALLALCARCLAPHGVAYLSYNTYPGWKQREAVRELMLLQIGEDKAPADRLAAAHQTLGTLDKLLAGRPEHHAELTREIIAGMKHRHPAHFYHDDLDGVNDPCYFLQFAAWVAEHGLAYLAEAEWETMFPELLASSARDALKVFTGDRLRLEQHLDFLRNRTFRCSLLVHAGQTLHEQPDPAALRGCRFGSPLRPPVGLPDLTAGVPVRFGARAPRPFETKDPVVKAFFTVLATAWPRRVPFAELLATSRRLLTSANVSPGDDFEHQFLARLFDACGRKLMDFLDDLPVDCALQPPPAPRVHPLTRAMAAQGLPLANVWHESLPLDPAQRALLATLDGTRTEFLTTERRLLAGFAATGLLEA